MNWSHLYASRIDAIGHSDVVAILKLAERSEIISFAGGLPDPTTFFLEEIKEIFEEIITQRGPTVLGYGPIPGIAPLRDWLAERMTLSGRQSKLEECLVTTGGIAALDLVCKVFIDPGDVVIVGEPTYVAALHVFKSYQARFAGIPLDDKGMQPEALLATLKNLRQNSQHAKFIYLVPTFQNPSGVTLSEDRRNKIIQIANEYGVPIIEDEAYRDLCFEGQSPQMLASLDPQNVIHISTFSKIFNPGVRLGWITASEELINTLILAKQGQDQCASTIGQYLLFSFAEKGLIQRQTSAAIEIYRRKRDAMLAALEKHFPQDTHWTKPQGGFYTWVTLSKHFDTEALLPKAIEGSSVAYVPGPAFYHNRSGKERMRLCYSYVPESQIEEGIKRLGQLLSAD